MANAYDIVDHSPLNDDDDSDQQNASDPYAIVGHEPLQASDDTGADPYAIVGHEPLAPDSAVATAGKSFARSAIPNTVGALAGIGTGALLAPEVSPFVSVPAGFAAAGAVTYAAQKAQDTITDALGITSPEQQAADVQAHPTAATIGELGTAAITFGAGLEASLAKRALSGGIVGAVNVGQQYAETGTVDPTQALAAAAVGAALPNVNKWAQDTSETLASRLGGKLAKSGTQVAPNSAASTPVEQQIVTNTPPATPAGAGNAFEHGQTPGTSSDQSENPAAGMDAVQGGFSAGVSGLPRDQGKGSPIRGEGIAGAPSTTVDAITPGIGGQDNAAALTALQPEPPTNNGQLTRPQEQPSPVNGPPRAPGVEPTPNAPPEGQNGIQATPEYPPPNTAGLDRRQQTPMFAPYEGPERRLGVPGAANPDEGLLQSSQMQRQAADRALAKAQAGQGEEAPEPDQYKIPDDNSIPDFLKRGQTPPPKFDAIAQRQQFQGSSTLKDATAKLEKSNGTQYQQQPPATQKAIDAADDRLDRVPLRSRNAFDDWVNKTFLGKMFNPQGIDPSGADAKTMLRSELGEIQRMKDTRDTAFTPEIRDFVNNLTPEQQHELQMGMQEKNPMERLSGLPEAEPFVRAVRQIMKDDWNFKMKKGLMDPLQYEENHFPQMWKNEGDAAQFLDDWRSRQGSKAGFKTKQFPTIADGLAAGLKLRYDNPIDAVNARLDGDYRYQMLNSVIDKGIAAGIIRGTPQTGDIQLNANAVNDRKLFAPEGFATVFNNHYSPGFRTTPAGQQFMDVAQPATSWGTSLLLGLSPFHAFTMANEGFINQIKLGMQQLARDPAQAVKTLAASPWGAKTIFDAGGKDMRNAWTVPGSMGPELSKVVNLLENANGRMYGHSGSTLDFRIGGTKENARNLDPAPAQNILEAWSNAFKQAKNDVTTDFKDANGNPIKVGAATMKGVGAAMQAFTHPLFNYVIPQMKVGAFRQNISEWLLQNPHATDHEQAQAAMKEWDDIENRFGLMTRDNLFWNNKIKEGMQLGMTSATWTTGFLRGVAGGTIAGAMHPSRFSMSSKDYDPRIGSALALGISVALMSSVYQLLKTGKPPESLNDLLAGQTGGHDRSGNLERAMLPGFQKDVYGWLHDPVQEAENKLNIVPRTLAELATNKGWTATPKGSRYGPIANENDPFLARLKQYGQHILQNFTPIAGQQATKAASPGSKITLPERLISIREAPRYLNGSPPGRNKFIGREWRQAHGQ